MRLIGANFNDYTKCNLPYFYSLLYFNLIDNLITFSGFHSESSGYIVSSWHWECCFEPNRN